MGKTVRMLVAEDDADDVLLLKRAFSKAGFPADVHFVGDGVEAKEYLAGALRAEAQPKPFPKVVLLDLKMPRMDGFEVLQWIRREAGLERLPVVVLSSSREARDVDRAYALGASSYVAKPSNPETLTELVRLIHGYWVEWNQPNESGSEGL